MMNGMPLALVLQSLLMFTAGATDYYTE